MHACNTQTLAHSVSIMHVCVHVWQYNTLSLMVYNDITLYPIPACSDWSVSQSVNQSPHLALPCLAFHVMLSLAVLIVLH